MFVEGGGLEEVEFGLVGVWTIGGRHCGRYHCQVMLILFVVEILAEGALPR